MTDAPNAPAPARAPTLDEALAVADAEFARVAGAPPPDRRTPAAAPPASPPTAAERAEWRKDADRLLYPRGDPCENKWRDARILCLLDALAASEDNAAMWKRAAGVRPTPANLERLGDAVGIDVSPNAERARTPATTAPSYRSPLLPEPGYMPFGPRPAEPSADAAEVKRLADALENRWAEFAAWDAKDIGPRPSSARKVDAARVALHAAIDALAARASTVTAADYAALTAHLETARAMDEEMRAIRADLAAPAGPSADAARCECGHEWDEHLGCCAFDAWTQDVCDCAKQPPAVALGAERLSEGDYWRQIAQELGREVRDAREYLDTHAVPRVVEGSSTLKERVHWLAEQRGCAEAEVAALRADRDRDAKDAARWRAVRIVDMPRYFADWNEMGTEGRDIFADSLIDEAAARQSPASAPQPDVWYRSTIRPSSIPYLTRSIREIDEP